MESYAVGRVDEYSLTVAIPSDSYWALTPVSNTGMISLTQILVLYFVTNIAFDFSLNSNRLTEIECVGHLTDCFGL